MDKETVAYNGPTIYVQPEPLPLGAPRHTIWFYPEAVRYNEQTIVQYLRQGGDVVVEQKRRPWGRRRKKW